jgi:protein-S-isoprenylcysteine O-methyltransferase Ste14
MPHRDLGLYLFHAAFWGSFGVTRLLSRSTSPEAAAPKAPAVSGPERVAPWSRAVLMVHMVAFTVMYFGIGNAVIPDRVPDLFPGQRWLGGAVILLGAIFASWALAHFKSWRYRAALAEGHELATDGPFGIVRHPIYLALDLLALGSALWAPTATIWIGAVLMALGSDLRARAEERLLVEAFGDRYREYMARTSRFLPGIY